MKKLFASFALMSLFLTTACSDNADPAPSPVQDEVKEKDEVSKENKEVTYYESETKPFIDEFLNKYDNTWNNIWVITMDRVAKNDISTPDAHTQIKKVYEAYKDLSMNSKIPTKKLSKSNKKLAKEIIDNLNLSAVNRQSAAEIALEILETNSDAKINEMNEKLEWSNDFMSKAQNSFIKLESNLYN